MNFKDWLLEKDFAFHRIETLVFLLIMVPLPVMKVVIPFVKEYFPQSLVHFSILAIVELSIVAYWYYNRSFFPRGSNSKMNLVIAIITENAKQKTRITHDFKKEIQKQLCDHNLETKYSVTVLHNHLSRITQNKINLYLQSLKASLISSEDVISFERLKKRLNAKFIIYGDLIKRNPTNSTYCLSFEAMILHAPTDIISGQNLHKEFQDLWRREVTFLESNELTGFKTNAEHIFFTASYMIGLTTFTDYNYKHGIEIWESLEKFIKSKTELAEYSDKILKLKSASYYLQSRLSHFKGEIAESLFYRNKLLEITPNEYSKYLNEAINQVKLRNDPSLALDYVNKAEKISGKDGTWRYNKFYLLIKLFKLKESLEILDEILKINFHNEIDTINQVISYNQTCLNEDQDHIQSHFIIGVLMYKKLEMPIPAYEKLESFINSAKPLIPWKILQDRAQYYISEIDKIIEGQ